MWNRTVFSAKSLFFSLTSLGKTRQGSCSSICLFLARVYWKIVLKEFLGPSNLPATKGFGIYKLVKIVIIGGDKNPKFATLHLITPSFKGFNNIQEFLVMSFVLSLCKNHLPRENN